MNHVTENNHRSLAAIAAELKNEVTEFIETRIALLKAEVSEKFDNLRHAAPLAGLGLVLLGTAYLLFTLSLVAVFAGLMSDTRFRWFFALLGVGILWSLFGGICLYAAKRRLASGRLTPNKTIAVLKEDKLWLQQEARHQL